VSVPSADQHGHGDPAEPMGLLRESMVTNGAVGQLHWAG
jgi:hypothetical protein